MTARAETSDEGSASRASTAAHTAPAPVGLSLSSGSSGERGAAASEAWRSEVAM